jgi:hypothetical protein
MIEITMDLDLSALKEMDQTLERECSMALRKAAFLLQRHAARLAPRDTGALAASIYVVTHKSDGRAAALLTAKAAAGAKDLTFAAPTPEVGALEAVVAVGVSYGVYVEYGHMARRGTASLRPRAGRIGAKVAAGETPYYQAGAYTLVPGYLFMTQAAELTRPYFEAWIADALKQAGAS